jgi:hypothetical protein
VTVHARLEHVIRLPLSADAAFPLFTPAGERDWVAGWDPEFIHPADGTTVEGMVFVTRHGGEETLWGCALHDPVGRRLRYARVTPGSRFVFVDVTVTPAGREACDVSVSYAATALTPAGAAKIAATSAEDFRADIEGWRTAIEVMRARATVTPGA